MPKHKPCNYDACVSKLHQTEPKGLTKVLGDAASHAGFLQLPGRRGHCHEEHGSVGGARLAVSAPLPSAPRPPGTQRPDGLRSLEQKHP